MNTTQIGDISEQKFVLRCLELEIPVLRPVGNNLPYDFVIEFNGSFKRIQVKTGYSTPSKSPGAFQFNTRSTSKNYSEVVHKTYDGLVDYFAVVYKGVDFVMLVPASDISKGATTLNISDETGRGKRPCSKYRF